VGGTAGGKHGPVPVRRSYHFDDDGDGGVGPGSGGTAGWDMVAAGRGGPAGAGGESEPVVRQGDMVGGGGSRAGGMGVYDVGTDERGVTREGRGMRGRSRIGRGRLEVGDQRRVRVCKFTRGYS
jgi:hypothetical protein